MRPRIGAHRIRGNLQGNLLKRGGDDPCASGEFGGGGDNGGCGDGDHESTNGNYESGSGDYGSDDKCAGGYNECGGGDDERGGLR